MLRTLLPIVANLGAGALLAWIALHLLARLAALRFTHEARSSHRALLLALVLASVMTAVPWLRALFRHAPAVQLSTLANRLELTPVAPIALAPISSLSVSSIGFYGLALFGAGWLLAFTLASALTMVSAVQLGALLRRARRPPASLLEALACLCLVPPRLLVSDEASVPFAALPWSPVIVLPDTFASTFDREAQDLALEHELAHIRRRDLWTSVLVRGLASIFAFHPTARRLIADLAFAREAAVDAEVSARAPHVYASLLLDVAANARFDQLPRPVSLDDTALKRRLGMLTDTAPKRPRSILPLAAGAGLLFTAGLAAPVVFTVPGGLLPRSPGEPLVSALPPPLPRGEPLRDFWRSHRGDLLTCFAVARARHPNLRVHTTCTLEPDADGRIDAATAPIPEAPALQACIERAAASWIVPVLPPPPGLSRLAPPPLQFAIDLPE
jgi:Zn-dependent protease with chaperone function